MAKDVERAKRETRRLDPVGYRRPGQTRNKRIRFPIFDVLVRQKSLAQK